MIPFLSNIIFFWFMQDIHFFGFQNDLTRPSFHRNAQTDADAVSSTYSASSDSLMSIVPMASRDCLLRLGLYEAAMYDAEAAAVSVAKRVCYGDISASTSILKQVRFFCNVILVKLTYSLLCVELE